MSEQHILCTERCLALEAERDALRKACQHYEAALKAVSRDGAAGQSFRQWNEARKLWEYWK